MPIIEQNEKGRNWLKDAVVYQVYVRSFKDSNKDGIGDIGGLIEKLDYLNDGTDSSLGVDTIWINPVSVSPMKDFGYDISDYCDIDPVYGGMEAFEKLIEEAHKRGIRVMMDFVPNHTSSEHPWFKESRDSRENPKRSWYVWKDPKPDGSPPNNWLSKLGGPAWTFDDKTGQYYLHKYLPEQPDLNWRSPDVREEMKKVMAFWLDKGVDGFRTDAINQLIEDESFADDPENPNYDPGKDDPYDALLHVNSRNHRDNILAIRMFCDALGAYQDRVMVTEAHVGVNELGSFYDACSAGLIVPFNFNLIGLPWNAKSYKMFIENFESVLRDKYVPNYVLGNHDLPRVASRLGSARARLAALMLLTLRGTPFIYYGDELGMEDVYVPEGDIQDSWAKKALGAMMGRDAHRTPMQWDTSAHAGFAEESVRPWLPLDAGYRMRNVHEESADPGSMLSLYRTLIHLRKGSPALSSGGYDALPVSSEDVFAYRRVSGEEEMIVIVNFGEKEQKTVIPAGHWRTVFSTGRRNYGDKLESGETALDPLEGVILKKEPHT